MVMINEHLYGVSDNTVFLITGRLLKNVLTNALTFMAKCTYKCTYKYLFVLIFGLLGSLDTLNTVVY